MSVETTIFEQVYQILVWARCKLRIGRTVVERAICSGIGIERENTDQGQYGGITSNVRLLVADEPDGEIKIRQVLEILQEGKTAWVEARVGGRFTSGGVTRLTLEAVHE